MCKMWHNFKDSWDESPSDQEDVQRYHRKAEEANSCETTQANEKDLVFKVGGKPIKIVETCKYYLGRVTAKNNNDEEAVKQNLGLARGK